MLLNLCLNAREAMPRGGRLRVATTMAPEGLTAVLQVRDTGRGFSEKVLKQLFHTPVSDKDGCAGLGLWLSHRIVRECGGEIAVLPRTGDGTCVEVRFPARTG